MVFKSSSQRKAVMAKIKKFKPLREVRVTYSDNTVQETNMAADLKDKEITDYFKVGRVFNLGHIKDRLVRVKKVKILK